MIYISCYLFLAFSYLLGRLLRYRGILFLMVGALPSLFTVAFRGAVGVDTAVYFASYEKLISGEGGLAFEPGFVFLIEIFSSMVSSPQFIQGGVSLLVALLLVLIFYTIDKRGFIFVAVFYPIFFFELTMNAVRFGLAFCFFMLGLIFLKKNKLLGGGLVLGAASFHVSTLLLVMLAALKFAKKLVLVLLTFFSVFGFLFFYERLVAKVAAYGTMVSPSFFSGVGPLILTVAFLGIAIFSIKEDREAKGESGFFLILLLCAILAFVLSKFTYAGLRVQWLLLAFSIFYFSIRCYWMVNIKCSFLFSIVGILGFSLNYRYYVEGYMEGESPFLPYFFYWE